MKKFEVGKKYYDGTEVAEIIKRTEKTISYVIIQHEGKINERKSEVKKKKIYNWETEEVFYSNCFEFHA